MGIMFGIVVAMKLKKGVLAKAHLELWLRGGGGITSPLCGFWLRVHTGVSLYLRVSCYFGCLVLVFVYNGACASTLPLPNCRPRQ